MLFTHTCILINHVPVSTCSVMLLAKLCIQKVIPMLNGFTRVDARMREGALLNCFMQITNVVIKLSTVIYSCIVSLLKNQENNSILIWTTKQELHK